MIRPLYTELVTAEERSAIFGECIKQASARTGIKEAQILDKALELPGHVILGLSVLTGVPIGIASHMVARAMKSDANAQAEQRARIKYYRDVTNELEQGITGTKVPPTMQV